MHQISNEIYLQKKDQIVAAPRELGAQINKDYANLMCGIFRHYHRPVIPTARSTRFHESPGYWFVDDVVGVS